MRVLAVIALLSLALVLHARADATPAICQPHDDKTDAATVDSFFMASLAETGQYGFSQPLVTSARSQAKSFLEQRIADKRAEICAANLKLAEDIKAASAQAGSAECSLTAVASLLDQYATQVAGTYDQNRQVLNSLLNAHVQALKVQLFNIAKGSTAGLNGSFQGVPLAAASQGVKFEWIKAEATKMGNEAHVVWGASNGAANPLVQQNLDIGKEAMRAKQAATKAHLQAAGVTSATSCKAK